MRRFSTAVAVLVLSSTASVAADPPAAKPAVQLPAKLPITGLAPSKLIPNLCLVKYPSTTTSPECQAFLDQGLGYYYSYVWMEAARSYETATLYDPNCAIAQWQLSRALEKWGRNQPATDALLKADKLKQHASWREQQLILSRMQEKGQASNVGDQQARQRAAIQTIDNLIAVHEEDEEAWYYRATLAGGNGFGGVVGAVPFYKALLMVNPLHPGANHELVHYYENCRRPALGMPYAENYIKSSPGIPHPFHMQAHLATRIGRWDKTSDRSARAVELERVYHKEMNVKPGEDHQYSHHLEILTTSLVHDGRYSEAKAAKEDALKCGYRFDVLWFRLHVGESDWAAAEKIIDNFRRRDKTKTSYLRALLLLRQGDCTRASPEVEVLRDAAGKRKADRGLEMDLWEAQGLYLCMTGSGEAGIKLLERAVQKTKDDYRHHAWGNGSYYMEQWGVGAFYAGRFDVAEEAWLEALAHDAGSVRGALGLHILCEHQGRTEEARRYLELAHKAWAKALPQHFDAEMNYLRNAFQGGLKYCPKTTTQAPTPPIP